MRCRPKTWRRPGAFRTNLAVGICAALMWTPGVGVAQQNDGGVRLTFGTTLGGRIDENRELNEDSEGTTFEGTLGLDLRLSFADRIQRLELFGDVGLRGRAGEDAGGTSDGIVDPAVRLSYERAVPDASLDVDAFLRQTDIALLEPLAGGVDDPLVLEDLDDLSEEGTRLSFGFDTVLELRRRAPFGITLSAGATILRFSDTDSSELNDEDRFRAGLGFRFNLSPVTRANVNFGITTFNEENDDQGRRDTFRFTSRLTHDRPNGSIGALFRLVSTEDGERLTFSLERSLVFPVWTLSSEIGVTRADTGDIFPRIDIRAERELPTGSIALDFRQAVVSGSDDEEDRVTTISLDYEYEITQLSAVALDLSFIRSDPTGSETTETFGRAALTYRRTLTRDWSFNVGLEQRFEDDGNSDLASGTAVTFNLRREVSYKR